jgi:Holliday junction DNA helicase RuvA
MIAALRGKVFKKKLNSVLIDVNNIIYEVYVSINTYSKLNNNDEVFIYITEFIREDSYILYGFLDELEKKMFDTLIKISGVGPKVALAVCSTFTPQTFANIVQTKNITILKQVPGIGPKSASRILVELEEFSVGELSNEDKIISDTITALENLGFKKEAIQKILKDIKANSTEEAIKMALKKLATF